METGKLLKIIDDIQNDEKAFNFQSKFQKILNLYDQNNPDELNKEKQDITDFISRSLLNDYVMTDYKILEGLNISSFFGINSSTELEKILSSQAHEVKAKLGKFTADRQEALNKLDNIKKSLQAFNIEAITLGDDQYEIAFSFPEEYTDLNSFEEVLDDIKKFLTSLASAIDEEKIFRIKYVNNGSIEVYINAGIKLAEYFNTALEYALKYYGAIRAYQEIKKAYQNFNKKRRESMEKLSKEELDEKTKSIIDNFVEMAKIKEPEDQNSVKVLFKKMLKHLEKGVNAEVRTPSLPAPEQPPEDDAEAKKEYRQKSKIYQLKKEIDAKNKEIFRLQQNNFDGMSIELLDGENTNGSEDTEASEGNN